MIKAREINYQEEIEKLLKIPKIKEFSQLPYLDFLKDDTRLYYEELLTRFKELERQRELQATPPPGVALNADHQQSDQNNLLFIHNSRQWQLLKEQIKQGVFIDKLLIILSHEFLLYEKQEITITLEKLCNYLMIDYKKANLNYVRKEIKSSIDFLIERDFIKKLIIKKSVLKCTLNSLFISELKEKRIITKATKSLFSLSSDKYKIARITQFFENNLNKKDININILLDYIKDSNKSRKKRKILDFQKLN